MSGIKGLGAKCPGIITSPCWWRGEGDTWDLLVIDKVVPGSRHLYLATWPLQEVCGEAGLGKGVGAGRRVAAPPLEDPAGGAWGG